MLDDVGPCSCFAATKIASDCELYYLYLLITPQDDALRPRQLRCNGCKRATGNSGKLHALRVLQ